MIIKLLRILIFLQILKKYMKRAYNMLSTGEYEAKAFTKFIKEYPDNKLSSNAYYWLGETFYVRKNYQLAAYNFGAVKNVYRVICMQTNIKIRHIVIFT